MKYKIGDKIRIKTWEKLKEEFGTKRNGDINTPVPIFENMEKELKRKSSDREAIIESNNFNYSFKEIRFYWSEEVIECLVCDSTRQGSILNRFEILDIR